MIAEGEKFPEFTLPNQKGWNVNLSSFSGKWLVLYVYPKDDTPGCTIQGRAFTMNKDAFDKLGVTVLGLSADGVESHKNFCDKFAFKIDLLADVDAKLLKAAGVGQTDHKGTLYWDRTTFVINPQGTVVKVYQKVQAQGHDLALLSDLKKLMGK